MDVFELDAASNNGVGEMRDAARKGCPRDTRARRKVYIVDEVHMLSPGAGNALLKTLEEPPDHVVFVLATTDPHKVPATVRSRTQHYDFLLVPPDALRTHLEWVAADAKLGLAPEAVERAVVRGNGSVRDALVGTRPDRGGQWCGRPRRRRPRCRCRRAVRERDANAVLVAVAEAVGRGTDPRLLARAVVDEMRSLFLALLAPELVVVADAERAKLAEQAKRLGTPAAVRAIEMLGTALVDMRDAVDPRVCLEAALVRLARPELDPTPEALLDRLERLERRVADGAPAASTASPAVPDPPRRTAAPAPPPAPPARKAAPAPPPKPPTKAAASSAAATETASTAPASGASLPSR